ncbi:MAG TPA: hypothetical protein VHH92_02445 [Actinomycetota bacterium]|nr:hypothetical protein [Actinomycetota bacterium]
MSAGFCSVCGAVLRDGVCPHGHPQRANRRQFRRRRGSFRRAIGWILVIGLLTAAAYVGLVWYPRRAAADLMRPASEDFAVGLASYRSAVSAFPPAPTDPEVLVELSNSVLTAAGDAREDLARVSARLEQRRAVSWPVISSRPPLGQARATREDMIAFSTSALETVAALEGVAGYVTQVAAVLPQLDNVQQTLGSPSTGEVGGAVAESTPIADQVLADVTALTPPEELGGLHAALLAIAQRIRDDLDEIARAGQQGSQPLVNALVRDVRTEIASFRETLGAAPRDAHGGGLGDRKNEVDRLSERVLAGLTELRDDYGITGLTFPEAPPPPTGP